MDDPRRRPRKSLRTLLMLWFLMFSVVPLAFITGYSLVKYEQAINQELSQRLIANLREIEVILSGFQEGLVERVRRHSRERTLAYYLSTNRITEARALATNWMKARFAPSRLALFGRDGRLEVSLYLDDKDEVQRRANLEGRHVYISEGVLEQLAGTDLLMSVDFKGRQSVDLVVIAKVRSPTGLTVGYIEEIIEINKGFLTGLKDRMNLEVLFFPKQKTGSPANPALRGPSPVIASHTDLETYPLGFFMDKVALGPDRVFDLNLREEPFGFIFRSVNWGNEDVNIGLGASKRAVKAVLKNVNYAFFTVVGFIVIVLVFLSLVISRILLKPLSDLVRAIQGMKPESPIPPLNTATDNEFGLVVEAFNEMSEKVNRAQRDLRGKIKELEDANLEIRETQTKLVHTAKMASLGQLVAGIAHELNNPIGFIYSNMGHLRDYSQRLISLVEVAETKPERLAKEKDKVEFDYIVDDLPKLIRSCEDGARRTRDIVLGLRNFSRLEEAKLKEVDIHEGIETTLQLLQGELKGRIEVKREFGSLPMVLCYPSQLNQVFMNILSNAAQAIDGEGEITVQTRKVGRDKVEISIRDTGKGMTPATLEKIFDPFFTTKTLGKGTGLGLSISYGIVQNHGGDIQAKSELGKGTEFIITLPIKSPHLKSG